MGTLAKFLVALGLKRLSEWRGSVKQRAGAAENGSQITDI
jgi:hypothetical protein